MYGHVIAPGCKKLGPEIPFRIRREIAPFSSALATDHHCSMWYQRSTRVAHSARDRSSVGCLAEQRQSAESEYRRPEQSLGSAQRHVPRHHVPTTTTAGGTEHDK